MASDVDCSACALALKCCDFQPFWAGFAYGATDEFGYHAAENRMHLHDFHATLLALLGLDHLKLTYRYSGRDFRLTDTAGNVHDGIFA